MEERVKVKKECVLSKELNLTCRLNSHIDDEGNCKYSVGLYLNGELHGALVYRGSYDQSLHHYYNVEILCL